jgi:hypothetical protein
MEQQGPYTATNPPSEMSQLIMEMLANALARVFHRWQLTMPHYQFTEETICRICKLALTKYEAENHNGETEGRVAHD